MISLLRSKFDLARKRAVFITSEAVLVFHWHRGTVAESFAFDVDEGGQLQFDRYLREWPKLKTYILVDVVEEEYRPETIPHVYGSDRDAVIARKQAWLFRGTPYCNVLYQGREAGGRRDDRVLFSAILNPQVLTPWVQFCTRNKVPLVGTYSLPILSRGLLPSLGIRSRNALLVTLQSCSGLRQTYFIDGAMKLSRLARMPRLGTVPFAPYVLGELEKFQRYLQSLRLAPSEPLDIYLLTHGDLLDDFEAECKTTDAVNYRLIDVSEAARLLGVHGVLTTPYSDYLFAHMLLSNPPKNHYATPAERTFATLYDVRRLLWRTSLSILVGSTLIAAINLGRGVMLKQDAADRLDKAVFYESRMQQAKQGLPPTPVDAAEIRSAVNSVDELRRRKSNPFTAFVEISQALASFPALKMEAITWAADASSPNLNANVTPIMEGGTAGGLSANTTKIAQAAIIEGRVEPFDGDFRAAIDLVNGFAKTLRGRRPIREVVVLKQPLDVSSKSTLAGSSRPDRVDHDVDFTVKVILGAADETG